MGITPGSHILEVGVGTGINTSLYPKNCQITGIDLSTSMLDKARERVAVKRFATYGCWRWTPRRRRSRTTPSTSSTPVSDQRRSRSGEGRARDAARLQAWREDHHPESFPQRQPVLSRVERAISPLTVHIGFKSDSTCRDSWRRRSCGRNRLKR
jgi:phosphatidylethanolamine/phosphatidyl-N-methylethanolamine N-methyltransferase